MTTNSYKRVFYTSIYLDLRLPTTLAINRDLQTILNISDKRNHKKLLIMR